MTKKKKTATPNRVVPRDELVRRVNKALRLHALHYFRIALRDGDPFSVAVHTESLAAHVHNEVKHEDPDVTTCELPFREKRWTLAFMAKVFGVLQPGERVGRAGRYVAPWDKQKRAAKKAGAR